MLKRLNDKPEHERLRWASLLTLIAGLVLVIVWATILLPLQLKYGPGGSGNQPEVAGSQDSR